MKRLLLTILIPLGLLSCGHSTIDSKEDAVKFLESNKFYDESATISGQGGGKIKSGFTIKFENGNAVIEGETLPYTIEEMASGGSHFSGPGYLIQFCGSQRYAYGGCIKGYLSGGFKSDGSKAKNGPSLQIEGDYVKAYFSYVSDGSISKK